MDEKRVWVQKLQEEAEIPDIVWQKAEQTFEVIQQKENPEGGENRVVSSSIGRQKHRRGKRKIAVVILAAVLMISTLTVGATTYFSWNNRFSERHQVTPEMEKKLNESNAAKEMNQYTEHDGIRIEAVQSVADNNMAHIVLMMKGSDEFPLNSHMGFESIEVQVEGNEKIGYFAGFIDGAADEDWSDGIEYEITIEDDIDGVGLLNKPIKLTFKNITDSYEGKLNNVEAPVLLESSWELTLNLDNEDSGKVYEVNQQIPGSEAVVKSVRLSSISYTMDLEWDYKLETLPCTDENGQESTFEHLVYPPDLTGLVYEDGTVSENALSILNSSFTNEEKTEFHVYGYNFNMVDYENVSELIFMGDGGNVRVPVEKQ